MADSKYVGMNKDSLVNEIKTRRAAGRKIPVDLRATEDKLASALDADDMENGDFDPNAKPLLDQVPDDAEELTPQALKAGAAARADGITSRQVPEDLNEYSGEYRYRETGEIFGLKVMDFHDVRANKTHHAKSPLKFWDGTEEEFRQQFDKL